MEEERLKRQREMSNEDIAARAMARFHSLAGVKMPRSKKDRYAIQRMIRSLRNAR